MKKWIPSFLLVAALATGCSSSGQGTAGEPAAQGQAAVASQSQSSSQADQAAATPKLAEAAKALRGISKNLEKIASVPTPATEKLVSLARTLEAAATTLEDTKLDREVKAEALKMAQSQIAALGNEANIPKEVLVEATKSLDKIVAEAEAALFPEQAASTDVAPSSGDQAQSTASPVASPAAETVGKVGTAVTTPSGLIFTILKAGDGDSVVDGDTVSVHYTGTLKENGKKFDSSLDRGTPFEFTVGAHQVIAGWDEGLKGMKKGEKRKLEIPADLGYGKSGAGDVIPPNSTLLFEIELLDIRS